jgi:acyl-CoA synthetase (NDP forming)
MLLGALAGCLTASTGNPIDLVTAMLQRRRYRNAHVTGMKDANALLIHCWFAPTPSTKIAHSQRGMSDLNHSASNSMPLTVLTC